MFGVHVAQNKLILYNLAMKKRTLFLFLLVLIALGGVCLLVWRGVGESDEKSAGDVEPFEVQSSERPASYEKRDVEAHLAENSESEDVDADVVETAVEESEADETEPQTEEEKREAEEERLVEEFDSLTDKWMDEAKDEVSMKDVNAFADKFRSVPVARKEECLQRALNLIPDENVMLLAGILLDKEQDKELVELVFNDVLNRDEDVKEPILQQIYKDKEHPCWPDVAWILDVTGDAPKGSEAQENE